MSIVALIAAGYLVLTLVALVTAWGMCRAAASSDRQRDNLHPQPGAGEPGSLPLRAWVGAPHPRHTPW